MLIFAFLDAFVAVVTSGRYTRNLPSFFFQFSSLVIFSLPKVFPLAEIAGTFYKLHGNMQAYFFIENMKNQGACMETFCRNIMQLPLFEVKLKTIPILHRRDHFVFTRKFRK